MGGELGGIGSHVAGALIGGGLFDRIETALDKLEVKRTITSSFQTISPISRPNAESLPIIRNTSVRRR